MWRMIHVQKLQETTCDGNCFLFAVGTFHIIILHVCEIWMPKGIFSLHNVTCEIEHCIVFNIGTQRDVSALHISLVGPVNRFSLKIV